MEQEQEEQRHGARAWTLGLLWVIAAVVATGVGILAVTTLGASLRDRGPVGTESPLEPVEAQEPSLDPAQARRERTISDDFGELVVACQGYYAVGVDARANEAAGWQLVSFETEPDEDIDAVFANTGRSVEIEVYCNRGEPTVSDLERNTLPDADDDS